MGRFNLIIFLLAILILVLSSTTSATISTTVELDTISENFNYQYQLQNDTSENPDLYISEWSILFADSLAAPVIESSITTPDNWLFEYSAPSLSTGFILNFSIDRNALSTAEERLATTRSNQSAAQEYFDNLSEQAADINGEITSLETQITNFNSDISQLQENIVDYREKIVEFQDEILDWTDGHYVTIDGKTYRSVEELEADLQNLEVNVEMFRNEIDEISDQIEDNSQQIEILVLQLKALELLIGPAMDSLTDANTELSNALLEVEMLSGVAPGDILGGFGFSSLYDSMPGQAPVTYENALTSIFQNEAIGMPGTIGDTAPVPEPATMILLVTGLVSLAGFRRKYKKM